MSITIGDITGRLFEHPPEGPFPTIKSARFIKNRYRKTWKALIQLHGTVRGELWMSKWFADLRDTGHVFDSIEHLDFKISFSVRRVHAPDRFGRGLVCYYNTMTVNDSWTIIWGDGNKVGFYGDRKQFEQDAVVLAMALGV